MREEGVREEGEREEGEREEGAREEGGREMVTCCLVLCSSQDYTHELVCVTEREKFVIPVRGIGRRGVVDFPDEVHFPTAPVKVNHAHILVVMVICCHW